MRREWFITAAGLMLLASAVQGQWFRRHGWMVYGQTEIPIEQRIAQAFALQRSEGMDDWAWRDAVESQLAALGGDAVTLLAVEADRRRGYEADAARVAIFRIENSIDPAAALGEWIEQKKLVEANIRRVMGLRDLLPHHLMYVVEFAPQAGTSARERRVVSVAADGKVQVISDDAALGRFLGIELMPVHVEASRENIAEFACHVAAARYSDIYEFSSTSKHAETERAEATLKAGVLSGHAEVMFSAEGRVTTLKTEFTGTDARDAGAKLPESRATPGMPE